MALNNRPVVEHNEEEPLNLPPIQDTTEEEEVTRTFCGKCSYFFKNITIEPSVMMFIIPFLISNLGISNLSLEKACRVNLNFTDEICTSLKKQDAESQNEYEREVQRLVTAAMAWKTYLTATIPCVIGLFVGPWQDNTGNRKIFLIINLIGQVIACINNMLQVYFFKDLNLQALVFSDALIESLSGGMCVFVITVFAFISAITTEKSRTFRMGMVNFSLTVGFPIGTAASGFILSQLGYYGTFGIALSLHLVNLSYNVFVLKDPERSNEQKKVNKYPAIFFKSK